MQGGDIQVKSEEGKGSVFTFAIPVQIPDELDISELKMETGLKVLDKPDEIFPDNYKVLAAEDNKMNQFLLQYIFDQWHIDYTIVNNGQEVIDLLSKELFDIVLMDIQMPVVDGYQAVKWIREEFKSKIPIVAMTAFVLQGEKDKCFSYGMNDYLPKPIDEIILKQMLIKYLPQTLINHAYRYINLTYLKDVFNSDKQFIINVLELFKTQYPKDLLLLKQAIENKDVVKIKASAHHLKSTFTSVNAAFPFLSILEWLEELNTGITDWESIAGMALPLFEAEKTALLETNEVLMQL
jgi:CheY-like chemotaxis protein